jgi:riboflavin kinase
MMRSIIPTLKALALRGGANQMISVSTKELSEDLGVSQQTASNRILELLEKGLISRRLGTRGQSIRITREGMGLLRKEYADYHSIFGRGERVRITGIVSTGLGEGKYYLERAQYKKQLSEKLGFRPFEGTLNLKVNDGEIEKLDILPASRKIHIKGFKAEGRTFGEATCIPISIEGVECAIVLPYRSHHSDILEIISTEHLRKRLELEDGDEVSFEL